MKNGSSKHNTSDRFSFIFSKAWDRISVQKYKDVLVILLEYFISEEEICIYNCPKSRDDTTVSIILNSRLMQIRELERTLNNCVNFTHTRFVYKSSVPKQFFFCPRDVWKFKLISQYVLTILNVHWTIGNILFEN